MITEDKQLFLWAEAIHTAVYLRNTKSHSSLQNQVTPYEVLFKQKPSITHLHPFGQRCYVHIPKEARRPGSKLLARAEQGVFVGYTSKTIRRIYIPDRHVILESKDVDFAPYTITHTQATSNAMELSPEPTKARVATPPASPELPQLSLLPESSELPGLPPLPESPPGGTQEYFQTPPAVKQERGTLPRSSPMRHTVSSSSKSKQPVSTDSSVTTRSGRISKPTEKARYQGYYTTGSEEDFVQAFAYATQISADIPVNYNSAMSSPDSHSWDEAMHHELRSHQTNGTWTIIPRHQLPNTTNVVGSRWVYAKKYSPDGSLLRYKARLVAQGFSQMHRIDFQDTYSPVARFDSLRILIRLAASCNLTVHQMDFDTAYLNSSLSTKVYMRPPLGYSCPSDSVLLLRKALYGLKQSGREWYGTFKDFLLHRGFRQPHFDPCVFLKDTLIVAVYVDDLLLLGYTEALYQFKTTIATKFRCKDLGQARYLLGLELSFTLHSIIITQLSYARRVLERFRMLDCNPRDTPVDPNTFPKCATDGDQLADPTTYQALIYSLNYLVSGTRWDLAFPVSMLGSYSAKPNTLHNSLAKQVLRYLSGTTDQPLTYRRAAVTPSKPIMTFTMYADASWASDPNTYRSVSGYMLLLNDAPVCWSSKRQNTVAKSTCEAEYMACSHAASHLVWAVHGLQELNDYTTLPIQITTKARLLSDNKPALSLAEEQRLNGKTKHIAIHYHFVRERNHLDYTMDYVSTQDNLADLCTKALPRPLLQDFKRKLLNG